MSAFLYSIFIDNNSANNDLSSSCPDLFYTLYHARSNITRIYEAVKKSQHPVMSAVRVICGDTPQNSDLMLSQTKVTELQMRGLFLKILTRWQR